MQGWKAWWLALHSLAPVSPFLTLPHPSPMLPTTHPPPASSVHTTEPLPPLSPTLTLYHRLLSSQQGLKALLLTPALHAVVRLAVIRQHLLEQLGTDLQNEGNEARMGSAPRERLGGPGATAQQQGRGWDNK